MDEGQLRIREEEEGVPAVHPEEEDQPVRRGRIEAPDAGKIVLRQEQLSPGIEMDQEAAAIRVFLRTLAVIQPVRIDILNHGKTS